MTETNTPIIIEEIFPVPIKKVWNAITRLEEMKQWFFENIESFIPEPGFETQFTVHSNGRDFVHLWKLMEVIPEKKIVYNWKYDGYPGDSTVIFEVFDQGKVCMLRLTANGMDSFPQDIPEFSRESCIGGWNYFIGGNLKAYLGKGLP